MRPNLVTTIFAGVLLLSARANVAAGDSFLDSKIADRFDVAQSAYQRGDYNKALAETTLILLNTPVRVYFDMSGVDKDHLKSYQDALTKGVDAWHAVLPGDEIFEITDDKDRAMITVSFRSTLNESDRNICGHVFWKRKLRWDVKRDEFVGNVEAEVLVAKYEREDGPWHQPSSIQHIMTHELGHVLGLDDRPSRGDMMGPDVHDGPPAMFGTEELAAIKNLRTKCLKMRGWAMRHLKRWQDAEIAYRNALAIAPDDADARRELTMAVKHVEPSN